MILEIVQIGDPVLRQKCRPVDRVSKQILNLAENMVETMREADGIGIAAPQVGVDLRIAVVDVSHDPNCVSFFKVNGKAASIKDFMPLIFLNPECEMSGEKLNEQEGCLSIREIRAKVRRPSVLKARLPQLDGTILEIETDGLLARAIQHEVDHLNGVLFIDRISAASKARLRKRLKSLVE